MYNSFITYFLHVVFKFKDADIELNTLKEIYNLKCIHFNRSNN